MNTATQQSFSKDSLRKSAMAAGVLYLITFISIPTLSLYRSIHEPNYLLLPGMDQGVVTGGILEIIVALAGIGTAVALFPVLKRSYESVAVALVASRVLEASTIFLGVACLLSVVSLKEAGAAANYSATSHALVLLYDRIFLLGQSFMPAVNDFLLGYILYQSRLAPRWLAVIGMAGAAPLLAGWLAVLLGLTGQQSALAGIAAIPVALFEFSLGLWLIFKGFTSIGDEQQNEPIAFHAGH